MTIKAIGAGFGRTGTDSMREALTLLGLGPCHHMLEVITDADQQRTWRALAAETAPDETPDWEHLLAGFASCVDWPSAYYWRELMEAFPEAAVILTWRSPESWWASFEKTILPSIGRLQDPASLGIALVANRVFGGRPGDRDHAIACYEANVAAVKAAVPPERLLVHRLGDGWEPLCAHLGVPVPDAPYPSRNSAREFQARTAKD